MRELSGREKEGNTQNLINIIKTSNLSSKVVSNCVVSTDTSVGWCPASHEASPIRFFAASLSSVYVYQLGATILVESGTSLYLPQFSYRATQPFSAVAVPFAPRSDTPAFLLGYPGGEVQVAEVAEVAGDEWRVERVSLPRADGPIDCSCVAWNAYSDLIAVGDSSGRIHIVHLSSQHNISKLRFQFNATRDILFLSRSTFLSSDGSDTICLWDLRASSPPSRLTPPVTCPLSGAPPVSGVNVSTDRVVCVDQDGRCVVWDTRDTRHPLSTHQGHTAPHTTKQTGVCLTDNFICVGGSHSLVSLYHLQLPGPLCSHWFGQDTFGSATISRLEFSPRAQRIISSDSLGAVKLLEIETLSSE